MTEYEIPPGIREHFFNIVWEIVRKIPAGFVSTYGQIAAFIPCPVGVVPEDYKAYRARWVGYAMSACPKDVPWQRIINSQGKISIRDGAQTQRLLLEAEKVVFDSHDRIDMKKYGWNGPGNEWLQEKSLIASDSHGQLNLF